MAHPPGIMRHSTKNARNPRDYLLRSDRAEGRPTEAILEGRLGRLRSVNRPGMTAGCANDTWSVGQTGERPRTRTSSARAHWGCDLLRGAQELLALVAALE